ncbi:MAG: prephenate dehydrogenase/arogenate dehydrogenase family protein [Spirochaetales bacterium]|nr:prephenate dehydrogenase/arogenate dehydrogenase family protein [Spirochaetales bacterium]
MNIGVYGLGRFGFFWSELLAEKFTVYGYNRSDLSVYPSGVVSSDEKTVLDCDVLFFCVSISSLGQVLMNVADRINPAALIFDTCSVKVYPIEIMRKILPESVGIIGTHPMFGPDSGKNGVQNLPLVFTPVRIRANEAENWKKIFNGFNLKVVEISAEMHDRDAAFTQGVTHFIGRVLDGLNLQNNEISTTGYRNLLTIVEQTCNDPLQLFMDLQHYNPYTHDMRNKLNESLKNTMRMLAEADPVRDA